MDLIDREKLVQEIKSESNRLCLGYISTSDIDVEDIVQLIVDAPTVDVYTEQDVRDAYNDGYDVGKWQAVRHGRNENQKYHEVDEFRCSECGLHLEDWTRYVHDEDSDDVYAQEYVFKRCPECGAKVG